MTRQPTYLPRAIKHPGQYIPFAKTNAERQASGDPRLSIKERYAFFDNYYNRVRRAVDNMVRGRLLLCEDADDQVERLVNAGLAAGVPPPDGDLPPLESQLCHTISAHKAAKK
jgi:hypothetical protein